MPATLEAMLCPWAGHAATTEAVLEGHHAGGGKEAMPCCVHAVTMEATMEAMLEAAVRGRELLAAAVNTAGTRVQS